MKLYYPALFLCYQDSYTVEFPDLPGCITQGDSLEEAFEMAEDVACGWILTSIEEGEDLPAPSSIGKITAPSGAFVNIVPLNIEQYAKQYSTKSVKKTLSLPEWLNTLAEKENINFSQELQRALKSRLGLTATAAFDNYVTTAEENNTASANLIPLLSTTFNNSSTDSTSYIDAYNMSLPYSQKKYLN